MVGGGAEDMAPGTRVHGGGAKVDIGGVGLAESAMTLSPALEAVSRLYMKEILEAVNSIESEVKSYEENTPHVT